ncbi:hypothetical protein [Mitsuaria sp. GD03876]|uniref:hypothetical protein n=1 Tax=Mitsuaria sp. GD03876 TaxID=2975399 RepID=UPI00244CA9A3|nr:hypothetical protein [Mitsuaria sp. GD03876]MDH0864657.1 hypothetical protein [Mitsuaria sp. GD03876]
MIASEDIGPQWSNRLNRFDVSRSSLSSGAEVLASWLSDDVGSKSAAQAFIRKLNEAAATNFGGYVGAGNSFHVRVASGRTFIENQFVDGQSVLLKIEDAIALLMEYGKFLDDARRGQSLPPNPIPVKFEMEGSLAMEFYLSTGFPLGLIKRSW